MSEDNIRIDGSYGEGGGSIVRFSMVFAALLKKPVEIFNIRANRENPGLRTQHLIGIQLIQQIFGGQLIGAHVGSTIVKYKPNPVYQFSATNLRTQISTAASIGLIIQSLQIGMAGLEDTITVELHGGATYGLWAPSIDFIQHITLKYLKYFGYNFEINVEKHGFYPKGGSRVNLTLLPSQPNTSAVVFNQRESNITIKGISIASKQLERGKVAERTATSAKNLLEKNGFSCAIEVAYVESSSIGSGLTLWTDSKYPFGSSIVGQKGVSSEKVGQTVVANFLNDWNNKGVLDEFMTDQIIPFMGLHPSEIVTGPLTNHSTTNMWICKQFFPQSVFEITNIEKSLFKIRSNKK